MQESRWPPDPPGRAAPRPARRQRCSRSTGPPRRCVRVRLPQKKNRQHSPSTPRRPTIERGARSRTPDRPPGQGAAPQTAQTGQPPGPTPTDARRCCTEHPSPTNSLIHAFPPLTTAGSDNPTRRRSCDSLHCTPGGNSANECPGQGCAVNRR